MRARITVEETDGEVQVTCRAGAYSEVLYVGDSIDLAADAVANTRSRMLYEGWEEVIVDLRGSVEGFTLGSWPDTHTIVEEFPRTPMGHGTGGTLACAPRRVNCTLRRAIYLFVRNYFSYTPDDMVTNPDEKVTAELMDAIEEFVVEGHWCNDMVGLATEAAHKSADKRPLFYSPYVD